VFFTFSGVDYSFNISTAAGSNNIGATSTPVVVVSDTTAPTVTSIARQTPSSSTTSDDTLVFRVTFDEDVQNVDATDFGIISTSTADATSVTGGPAIYDVTVSGGDLATFTGSVGLEFDSGQNIQDLAGNALSNTTPGSNEIYSVTNTPEIGVSSSEGGALTDGGSDAQGAEPAGVASTVTYTITNSGTDTLTLSGTPTVSGLSNVAATPAVSAPGSLSLAPGGSTTFTVTYTPIAAGAFGFDLDIASDDADEATFDIAVSGNGTAAASALASTSGSGQTTIINTSFATRLVATLSSPTGVGVPNASVTFTAPATGASLTFASTGTNTETVMTDANGLATSSIMTANGIASTSVGGGSSQSYTVSASSAGVTDATYSLTNNRDSTADVIQTQEVIASFITNRADRIVSSQPDLVDRLKGGGPTTSSGFAFNATPNSRTASFQFSLRAFQSRLNTIESRRLIPPKSSVFVKSSGEEATPTLQSSFVDQRENSTPVQQLAFSDGASVAYQDTGPRPGFDFWAQGTYSVVENGNNDSEHALLFAGVDYRFNENALIGIMGQLDMSDEENLVANTAADGFGWMIGPYAVVRLSENLYFDGRLTFGESYNEVNALGLFYDDFSTKRALIQAGLTGDFETGDYTINPFIRATYYWEKQESYVDTLGNLIPSQTFDLGRIEFGPKITYNAPTDDGTYLEFYMSISGIYDFEELMSTPVSNAALASSGDSLRGKIKAGSMFQIPEKDFLFSAEVFYDGIGVDGFEAFGGTISLEFPF